MPLPRGNIIRTSISRFAYGQRDNGPEMKRRDMLTGEVMINIPIFYKSKQDRKVAETMADIRARRLNTGR